jgi:hypothetical protein
MTGPTQKPRVINPDGLTTRPVDSLYEFNLRDLAVAIVIVVALFGFAGYLSV